MMMTTTTPTYTFAYDFVYTAEEEEAEVALKKPTMECKESLFHNLCFFIRKCNIILQTGAKMPTGKKTENQS